MEGFGPEIAPEIVAACEAAAGEIAEAFSRALDRQLSLSVGEAVPFSRDEMPDGFDGAGLLVRLDVGSTSAVVIVPESTGLVPEWCIDPDPTGKSKLATLAQELGMLVLPERFASESFESVRSANLSEAFGGGDSPPAGSVPLELKADEAEGAAWLIWPIAVPAATETAETERATRDESDASAAPAAAPPVDEKRASSPTAAAAERTVGVQKAAAAGATHSVANLPVYTRSLLRIRIPVSVTLASKRQPVGKILEVGPGSILQFEKSCEELLDLCVGNQQIAVGEAVKVGDKFGIRISSIIVPRERFRPVRNQ